MAIKSPYDDVYDEGYNLGLKNGKYATFKKVLEYVAKEVKGRGLNVFELVDWLEAQLKKGGKK